MKRPQRNLRIIAAILFAALVVAFVVPSEQLKQFLFIGHSEVSSRAITSLGESNELTKAKDPRIERLKNGATPPPSSKQIDDFLERNSNSTAAIAACFLLTNDQKFLGDLRNRINDPLASLLLSQYSASKLERLQHSLLLAKLDSQNCFSQLVAARALVQTGQSSRAIEYLGRGFRAPDYKNQLVDVAATFAEGSECFDSETKLRAINVISSAVVSRSLEPFYDIARNVGVTQFESKEDKSLKLRELFEAFQRALHSPDLSVLGASIDSNSLEWRLYREAKKSLGSDELLQDFLPSVPYSESLENATDRITRQSNEMDNFSLDDTNRYISERLGAAGGN